MSAPAPTGAARELPNGEPFYSPLGLFDFQIQGVSEIYTYTARADGGLIAVWDTGIGKTVLAIAASAYLFDDGLIDQVVIVCERNKRRDWVREFEAFSSLDVLLYHGTGRQQRLAKHGSPQVLVTTYETGRLDLMAYQATGKRSRGRATDGDLMISLGLRGKRVLWVFDEATKLRGRRSELHHAFNYVLTQLRKGPHHQRVLALTGTPIESGFEDAYNLGRIVCPSRMPTVAEFERIFTLGEDKYHNPIFDPNKKAPFARMFRGCIIRKRKTDPDVVAQFPKKIEESASIEMGSEEREFAAGVWELCTEARVDETARWAIMRATAGHPAAHLHLSSKISKRIREIFTPEDLRSIGSAKTAELIERLRPLVKGQGAQVVIFSFFTSVIAEVARELREAGFSVGEYHGANTGAEADKQAFLDGETEILFCSDMGARGLNLQVSPYVIEYESALTFANREQRLNRVHRIVSEHPSVTCLTLVLHDTVEQNIFARTIDRNADQDMLLGDDVDGAEGWVSAEERRAMLHAYRRTRKR